MGEKDISQKNFTSHNDVVADIFNGSLFDGEDYINADSLVDAQPFSQYKADDGAPCMSRSVMLPSIAWLLIAAYVLP